MNSLGSTGTKETYLPSLDGLRAIAVMGVLYTHYWQPDSPWGHFGVRLFFVLSGFLITGILLRARERAAKEGLGSVYWTFMARRALRIFPAYYVLIIFLIVADIQSIQSAATWHLAHASNILFSLRNDHVPWFTGHYWSLSVEEQFYLLWPLLILTVRERWLWSTVVGTITAGIVFRCVAVIISEPQLFHWYFPFASLDALGAGALLALYVRADGRTRFIELIGMACGVIVAIIFAFPALSIAIGTPGHYIFVEAIAVPAMVAVVAFLVRSRNGFLNKLLSSNPIAALGRISFGIYLYHYIVLVGIFYVTSILGINFTEAGPIRFFVGTFLTIITASLSWSLLERPFLSLKRLFPY